MRRFRPSSGSPILLVSALSGLLLGLCGLPLAWSLLTPLPLAALLWLAASAPTPRQVAGRLFWGMGVYFAVQLWWLTDFMAELTRLPWGGLFVLPLFAIEGGFFALLGWLAARPFSEPLARVWALAGGWVLLEWLRTLGPLAFPWSGLGYTLLPAPISQSADLWGTLGLSLVVTLTAASLVSLALRRFTAPLLTLLLWVGGSVYGLTRSHADGPQGQALLVRSDFDSFGRASGSLSFEQQFQTLLALSKARRPGELNVWSETAIINAPDLFRAPAPGLYGVYQNGGNTAQSWDGKAPGRVSYTKLKPVPFGEFFPFSEALRPVYALIFRLLGIPNFDPPPSGTQTKPLLLNAVSYGTYICYDSIFAWVPRQMVLQGAQLLVNVSNDGWYRGWGVRQHFQMGRMRAIETRRWLIRSVNKGILGVVDDLGRPVQTLDHGEGVLHARYRLLSGQSVYLRVGDLPALLLALGTLIPALRAQRRRRRELL
ncbi:apolipoprotein N-acyltransferase [Deinococcus sp.]|uniref:apolipoprotein N-acyltransferase n=1 Tax=Deinococcus sp. TaxID=47478 RepID=UPI003CC6AD7E